MIAVLAFHFGVPGATGGYLGVDVFFVLSGFLITTLLLGEHDRTGRIDLRRFWARRARRLLPGLCCMLAALALWAVVIGVPSSTTVRGDAIGALGYVANWRFIASHRGYFTQFGPPSPVLHTWSLAIEEQFYLLWPLLVVPVVRRFGARGVRNVAAAGVVLSGAACAVLAARGADPTRLYYGTDTRAQAILIGAALAAAMTMRRHSGPSRVVPTLLPVAGAVCVLWSWHALGGSSPVLYRGGLTVVAASAAAVVAGVVLLPRSALARALAWRPLCGVGHISYELYLWHWPALLAVTRARTGWHGPALLAARVAVTASLAVGCWALVDRPVRDRRPAMRGRAVRVAVPSLALVAAVLAVATTAITLEPAAATRARAGLHLAAAAALAPAPGALAAGAGSSGLLTPTGETSSGPSGIPRRSSPSRPAPTRAARPVRAVLLGDSVALTLGDGLLDRQAPFGIELVDGGLLGCGVLGAGTVRVGGAITTVVPGCRNWEIGWRGLVAQVNPDVVAVLVGRWEVIDRLVNGRWVHIGDPAYDAYVGSQLDRAIADASSGGAHVVLLTTPHFAGLERPDGGSWPEDDPARVDRFNGLVRAAAARHPSQTSVFDLAAAAEPDGRYTASRGGVTLRRPDGVHFTQAGADLLAPAVLVDLVAAAAQGDQ